RVAVVVAEASVAEEQRGFARVWCGQELPGEAGAGPAGVVAFARPFDGFAWVQAIDAHLHPLGGAWKAEGGQRANGWLDDGVGGPEGGLATLGGDGIEEGGRIGVDLDCVEPV